jgi:hypothetical protein
VIWSLHRERTATLTGAAAVALVIGAIAGARSLTSDRAIPPAGPNRAGDVSGWITYGNHRGIWALDLTSPGDPADRVLLSSTPGTPTAWSRDGSKLLVLRDNDRGLFVLNSDGAETQLADFDVNGGDLSPDGTAVVYATGKTNWRSTIYMADVEGGSPRVLLAPGSRQYPDEAGRFETAVYAPA